MENVSIVGNRLIAARRAQHLVPWDLATANHHGAEWERMGIRPRLLRQVKLFKKLSKPRVSVRG